MFFKTSSREYKSIEYMQFIQHLDFPDIKYNTKSFCTGGYQWRGAESNPT